MQRKSSRIAASKRYDEGRQLEMAGDIDTAIKKYQKALSQKTLVRFKGQPYRRGFCRAISQPKSMIYAMVQR